jgi:hypothetical protein
VFSVSYTEKPSGRFNNMAEARKASHRVRVTLRQWDLENLDFISACTGLSRNDSVRKALVTEAAFQGWMAAGCKILIMDVDKEIREVVFVG